jgi:hypothetical protein
MRNKVREQKAWNSLNQLISLCDEKRRHFETVAEGGGILQLLLGEAGDITVELGVVLQRAPGNGIMAVAEADEAMQKLN